MPKKIILKHDPSIVQIPNPDMYKQELNVEQHNVVTHKSGPALVIAGAGSGKTRALTYRVAYLIESGISPESIVLVTFTKKAAQEMIGRVTKLVGKKGSRCIAGTFHHIANQTLHKYGHTIGLQNNFSVMDESDQKTLMKLVIMQVLNKEERKKHPNSARMVKIYSKQINRALTLKETLRRDFPQYKSSLPTIQKVLIEYDKAKHRYNQLDFDDLMLYFLKFLQEESSKNFKKQIQHVLVDEYQDVNAVQAKIIDFLSEKAKSLVVVGDDAQAIYRFRGADFSHMLNFPKDNPTCIEYKLEENFRSTPEILKLANSSIQHNKKQFKKLLRTTLVSGELPLQVDCEDVEKESRFIIQTIEDHQSNGIPLHKQAVLFRSAFHSIPIEQQLLMHKIPYEIRAGLRFFEKAHIKDLLAYLIIFTNPMDRIQWLRVLSMHPGISDVAAQKVLNEFLPNKNVLVEFVNADLSTIMKGKRVQTKGLSGLIKLQKLFQTIMFDTSTKPYLLLSNKKIASLPIVIEKIKAYITPYLKIRYPTDYKERSLDFDSILEFSSSYSSISSFLEDIITQTDLVSRKKENKNKVKPLVLSTIHQAKGLEWDVVYLINLVNGRMPSSQIFGDYGEKDIYALEEERRLFYVATTRAKKFLYLTHPLYVRQPMNKTIPDGSIFLDEIQEEGVFEEGVLEDEQEEKIISSWELYQRQNRAKKE
ncbi:MAG: ATP-dependent helicase [Candidatus Lokiarchaeota archaeon]|nr:ATP-dependent helicase [Candidatus Lokiarchaeota archaeon]